MHELSRELGVEPEFIRWTYETLFKDLDQNKFDVAIGGLIVNPERLTKANFSEALHEYYHSRGCRGLPAP